MRIPDDVVEKLKAIDPDLPIYDSREGWITYLVSRINMEQQPLAQRVYAVIRDSVFTNYFYVSELLRSKAGFLVGNLDEQNGLLFWHIETSTDLVCFAIKVGVGSDSQNQWFSLLVCHFLNLKPAPVEWLQALMAGSEDLRSSDERTIATYWRHTEVHSECWHHAIRKLEQMFKRYPMRAQLLLSIALEKQHEALKHEDPFKALV